VDAAPKTRVLLVDDHAVVRAAVRAVLERERDLRVAGEAGSAEAALPMIDELRPDVVVMDVRMPGMGGIDGTHAVRERAAPVRVLVLSMIADGRVVRRALQAGAHGYVPKTAEADDLVTAVRLVATAQRHVHPSLADELARAEPPDPLDALTAHEFAVARLVALGHTTAEVGASLGTGPRAVEHVRAAALAKLGAHTRAELVSAFLRSGRLVDGAVSPDPSPFLARSPHG
jgi:DNA-binding NarL/FixJ family response regulator